MPVNMTREDRGEVRRQVGGTNDVFGGREHVVRRTDGRPFDAVMHAEQANVRRRALPFGFFEHAQKSLSNVASLVRKPRERDLHSTDVAAKRSRLIEDVHVRMQRESHVWQSGSLVVSGHDEDRNSSISDVPKRFERLIGESWRNSRPVEDVAAVHYQINLTSKGWSKRRVVIREEVVASAASRHTFPQWEIEAQMRVGE